MKIGGGWDHRGRIFTEKLRTILAKLGHELVEMGATTSESSDYPDFGFRVAEAVSRGEVDRGILICGTGIGMGIAANKVRGVRAAVVWDLGTARASRAHNDSNILCIGEWLAESPELEPIIKLWLETPCDGGRHSRRVGKIMEYEKNGPCRI